jgi:hypothetical protein
MKRNLLLILGALAISTSAFAQAADDPIEKALMPAPRQMKEAATVIKWKPDFTYDVVKKGTNTLVCYDQSGWANEQPFSVQCTSMANLARVAQNKKFEAIADSAARTAALAAAEKDGTRVKPEFGSIFITMSGADKDHTRTHDGRRAERDDAVHGDSR